jgi:protein tyrosine phosphatase (PTP) superfamily phosphohydrolase (DUF442 family)
MVSSDLERATTPARQHPTVPGGKPVPTPASTPTIPPGLANGFAPLPGIITAGQPSAGQLEALARDGVATVVDLRGTTEPRGFDERALAERLGLDYHNIPVTTTLGAAEIDAVRALLRDRAGKAVLVHCKSANRVGGALLPYLILDEQLPREEALDVAQQVGLRSAELAQAALDYVDAADDGA